MVIKKMVTANKKLARWSASGRSNGVIKGREMYQHYGFASHPLPEANGIMITEGGLAVMIADDDRQCRVGLEEGQVAIYDCKGSKILLAADGSIQISATGSVTINAPVVNLGGSTGQALVTADLLAILTSHTHESPGALSTQLTTALIGDKCTSKTKAE